MMHPSLAGQRGVSLVEILVVLGVVAGLVYAVVPRMQEMVHSASLAGATHDLLADLHQARSEALKRNRRVALCKSVDGHQCFAGGGWEQGWIMFHDENGNGAVDAGEELISRREPLPRDLRLSGNQPVARYISYTAIGATKLTGGAFQAGTLTLCRRSATPAQGRQVILNAIGRPRVQKATVAMCG